MKDVLLFLCGILLVVVFWPPWLLCYCNAVVGDWYAKRSLPRTKS